MSYKYFLLLLFNNLFYNILNNKNIIRTFRFLKALEHLN
jgi:hypothetical protein